jgi:fructan beta-fructosidase
MRLFGFAALLALLGCSSEKNNMPAPYSEKYRPQYHFSPAKNWTNDPNGLIFFEGEYHVFYQYNPYGDTWGHMSWGHAVSKDLLHWEHLPVAIAEYQDRTSGDSTMIFSGTVVADTNNTSGLCAGGCLIAIFTSHVHKNNEGLRQHQSMAYSNDRGRTWTLYEGNPILDIQRKDFRDPKVFWYAPQQKWVMALVIPDLYKVQLYQSKNLLKWELMSEFGPAGDTSRIWECPDLYELPVANDPGKTRWVLSLSGSHPAGPTYVGMQYFVGQFDGTTFTTDQAETRYLDFGKDYNAGIIFNNLSGRTLMLGWLNNWAYANHIPTSPWRGAMSLPRELTLRKENDRYHLHQQPLNEVETLRATEIKDLASYTDASLELEFTWAGDDGPMFEFFIDGDQKVVLGRQGNEVYLDRTLSGLTGFHKDFAGIDRAPVSGDTVKVRMLIDQSVAEVFVNDGEATITSQVFAKGANRMAWPKPEAVTRWQAWSLTTIWQ